MSRKKHWDNMDDMLNGLPPDYVVGTGADGQPLLPDYLSSLGEDGKLMPQYRVGAPQISGQIDQRLSGIRPDMRGMEAFRHSALDSGPSAWLSRARTQSRAETRDSLSRAASAAASGAATARSGLAMRGGLSSGARERIQRGSARDMLMGTQQASREGVLDRMKMGVTDAQLKQDALSKLPGMENQLAGLDLQKASIWANASQADRDASMKTDMFNSEAALKDKYTKQQYDMQKYQEQMKGWAADKDANAQLYAADHDGVSFLCTELNKRGLISDRQFRRLGKFMAKSVVGGSHFLEWYFEHGPKLVEAAQDHKAIWEKTAEVVEKVLDIWDRNIFDAQCLYGAMVQDFNRRLGFPAPDLSDFLITPNRHHSILAFSRLVQSPKFFMWWARATRTKTKLTHVEQAQSA